MTEITNFDVSAAARRPTFKYWCRKVFYTTGSFWLIGGVIILWEAVARSGSIHAFLLPPLSEALWRATTDLFSGNLSWAIGTTLYRTMAAFILASVCGVVTGLLMARIKVVEWFLEPLIMIGLPMPKIALLPAFMIWFGLFDGSKIMITAFSAVFQVIFTVWLATRNIQRELIWSARSLGASVREIPWQIVMPAALPRVVTALQIALPICLIVELVTEFAMGGEGLGAKMLMASRRADAVGVFAGIIEIGLLGTILIKVMEIVRSRLLKWHIEDDAATIA